MIIRIKCSGWTRHLRAEPKGESALCYPIFFLSPKGSNDFGFLGKEVRVAVVAFWGPLLLKFLVHGEADMFRRVLGKWLAGT